ncbi:MAG: PTS sugar transporter subunit IIB [Erysipelotrichaceae bacterium]
MKILLVCAGGMSTSILMKRMKKYWCDKNIELIVEAVGLSTNNLEIAKEFDIVLVGPQISYRLAEIAEETGLPTGKIEPFDYAMANCANIMKLAEKLYTKEKRK